MEPETAAALAMAAGEGMLGCTIQMRALLSPPAVASLQLCPPAMTGGWASLEDEAADVDAEACEDEVDVMAAAADESSSERPLPGAMPAA